ncbi:uroporphyrinogen decarboxylase [Candidatus Odyssella thessalonicensis]|uniref:uroporphyrinogen decarboxylase n=1 Tax=Candidatus Odyssella thessalonicensis TaxID=84647 RepID=UPI000225C205|nr:uroporphyrinogen decarboxylase [Candidatus Odyssella thessalonicensis]
MQNRLLKTLKGHIFTIPPLWMMRQAGRYLPEYRAVREQAGSFWNLCFNPELACEVTLQPIRRFDYDAAIIFSDILVIPKAMGQTVDFAPNHGPLLGELNHEQIHSFCNWSDFDAQLMPVYEAIKLTRNALDPSKDLIGFAGSPWTIATYMIDGGKGHEFSQSRQVLRSVEVLAPLLQSLTCAITRHLVNQVRAGATAVQVFDSWAALVPAELREQVLFAPLREIVTQVRQQMGDVPIIYFGRGIAESYLELAPQDLNIALGVDQHANLEELDRILPPKIPLQGNLDPEILIHGGEELEIAVQKILNIANNRPFVFNLGHGILPQTPISHVEKVCKLVRRGS